MGFIFFGRALVIRSAAIIDEGPPANFSDHPRPLELF